MGGLYSGIAVFSSSIQERHEMKDSYTDAELEESYRQMAQDKERKAEALGWAEATIGDVSDYDDDDADEAMKKGRAWKPL